jgi:hypothetical protein
MKLSKRNLYLPTALMALGVFALGAGSFAEARPALEKAPSDARIEKLPEKEAKLPSAPRPPCSCISLNNVLAVEVRVTGAEINLDSTNGWGSHFSTTCNTNGWGGYNAECHLITGGTGTSKKTTALCYDGAQDFNNHHNEFILDLGTTIRQRPNKPTAKVLKGVNFFVTSREVKVQGIRVAINPYNMHEAHPYIVESTFPLRQSSGFWETNQFCYRPNSVLNNQSDRQGTGYYINVTTIPNP